MPQNNQTYWNNRKQQFSASLAKDETRLFAKLATYYEREAAALEKQIAAYYTQYGEGNVIAYRQLLQSLNDTDVQLLMQDMEAFAEKYPEYADLLPVRESIYKLNRLEGLQTSILLQQLEIGAVEQEQLTAFFLKQAARYANFSAELLGFGEQFYRIDSDMVKKAVGNSWCEGKNFSERIWDNRQKLAHTLQTEVVNGIIRGEDYHTLARNLRQKFTNVSRKQAERLVYTEDTYLSCETAITPFANDPSFTQYRFACTHDGNACDICKELDGEAFSIKERTPGTNFPPMHPWCRCFFEIVEPDLETLRRNEREKMLTSGVEGGILSDIESDIEVHTKYFNQKLKYYDITPERIQSIPEIKMDGLTEKENAALTNSCKDLLKYMQDSEVGTEGVLVLDKKFKEIDRYKGVSGKPKVSLKRYNQPYIALHNHPDGLPFSEKDIQQFIQRDNMIGLVAIGNDGTPYFIYKESDYNIDIFDEYVNDIRMNHLIEMTAEDHIRFSEEVLANATENGVAVFNGKDKKTN